MFNFTYDSNTCWTNASDPIIMSDQSLNPNKPFLINHQHSTTYKVPNWEQHKSVPARQDHDDHTAASSSPLSLVNFPPPDPVLFEPNENQHHQNNQHFQLPLQLVDQSQPALSVMMRELLTGKAIADCPASSSRYEHSTRTIDPDQPQLIPATRRSGSDDSKSDKKKNKRDRHSKIVTSSRPRHRRMRLSIDVARQFFDLQEMLGFERASKTVEWLLVRARSDIRRLAKETNPGSCSKTTASSTNSECEVISSLDHEVVVVGDPSQEGGGTSSKLRTKEKWKSRRRSCSQTKRRAFDPLAKEARDMARKRARERTREKLTQSAKRTTTTTTTVDHVASTQYHDDDDQSRSQAEHLSRHLIRFNGWINDQDDQYAGGQNQNLIEADAVALQDDLYDHHQLVAQAHGHDHLAVMITSTNATTSMIHEDLNAERYNSLQNSIAIGSGILQIPQEQQCLDYQLLVKAWNQFHMNSHNMG